MTSDWTKHTTVYHANSYAEWLANSLAYALEMNTMLKINKRLE